MPGTSAGSGQKQCGEKGPNRVLCFGRDEQKRRDEEERELARAEFFPCANQNRGAGHEKEAAEGDRVHVEGVQNGGVADVGQQQKRDGGNHSLDVLRPLSKRRQKRRKTRQAERHVECGEPSDIEMISFMRGARKLNCQPSKRGLAGRIRAIPEIVGRPCVFRLKESEASRSAAWRQAQPACHPGEIACIRDAYEPGKK